jgi:uncharacterized membrane protein YgdD (TMEM256/DUF423 family)
MDRAFLVIASLLGFLGVALGAFGSHALRARLTTERIAQFETGVRYQLWHALALFVVVWFRTIGPDRGTESIAGILFIVGVILFCGSLYLLAVTGARGWGAVTPVGGVCLLAGWVCLIVAAATAPLRFS